MPQEKKVVNEKPVQVVEPEYEDEEDPQEIFMEELENRLLKYLKAELDAIDPKAFDRAYEKLTNDLKKELLEDPVVCEDEDVGSCAHTTQDKDFSPKDAKKKEKDEKKSK